MVVWNQNPKPFVWTATVASIGKSYPLSADIERDSARLHGSAPTQNETLSCPVIYWTLPWALDPRNGDQSREWLLSSCHT